MKKVYVDAARKLLKGYNNPSEVNHPQEVYKALKGDYTTLEFELSEVRNYTTMEGIIELSDPEQVKKLTNKEIENALDDINALEKKVKYVKDTTKYIFKRVFENMKVEGLQGAMEVYLSEVGLDPLVNTRIVFTEGFSLFDNDDKDVRCTLDFLPKDKGLSVNIDLTYTVKGIQSINYSSCSYNPLTEGAEHIKQRNATLGWLSTPKGLNTFELFLAALMGEYTLLDKHLEGLNKTLKSVRNLQRVLETERGNKDRIVEGCTIEYIHRGRKNTAKVFSAKEGAKTYGVIDSEGVKKRIPKGELDLHRVVDPEGR